jgi:hypothetical protein
MYVCMYVCMYMYMYLVCHRVNDFLHICVCMNVCIYVEGIGLLIKAWCRTTLQTTICIQNYQR